MTPDNFSRLLWEELERHVVRVGREYATLDRTYVLRRTKVPGGWLVQYTDLEHVTTDLPLKASQTQAVGVGGGITFVPDPTYAWLASG